MLNKLPTRDDALAGQRHESVLHCREQTAEMTFDLKGEKMRRSRVAVFCPMHRCCRNVKSKKQHQPTCMFFVSFSSSCIDSGEKKKGEKRRQLITGSCFAGDKQMSNDEFIYFRDRLL